MLHCSKSFAYVMLMHWKFNCDCIQKLYTKLFERKFQYNIVSELCHGYCPIALIIFTFILIKRKKYNRKIGQISNLARKKYRHGCSYIQKGRRICRQRNYDCFMDQCNSIGIVWFALGQLQCCLECKI